jgi:hypothetical protein
LARNTNVQPSAGSSRRRVDQAAALTRGGLQWIFDEE